MASHLDWFAAGQTLVASLLGTAFGAWIGAQVSLRLTQRTLVQRRKEAAHLAAEACEALDKELESNGPEAIDRQHSRKVREAWQRVAKLYRGEDPRLREFPALIGDWPRLEFRRQFLKLHECIVQGLESLEKPYSLVEGRDGTVPLQKDVSQDATYHAKANQALHKMAELLRLATRTW